MKKPMSAGINSVWRLASGTRNQSLIRMANAYHSSAVLANAAAKMVETEAPKSRGRPVTIDREFPDPFANEKKHRRYFWAYGIGVVVSCAVIFNYEKTTSPIINSVFYFLRRNDKVLEALGEDIRYKSSWPWISGQLNTVKGQIDVSFAIKGDKSEGVLSLNATRDSRLNPFSVHKWQIVTKEGEVIDLKDAEVLL